MALLFAPRNKQGWIPSKYFHDFDMYFATEQKASEAQQHLLSLPDSAVVADTDNATTIKIKENQVETEVQLIKIFREHPLSIIGDFDFVNCACALTPATEEIHFHQETFRAHLSQELKILNPWMLQELDPDTDICEIRHKVITQLLRFKKYCLRWNYQLSKESLGVLMETYEKFPNLTIEVRSFVPAGQRPTNPVSGEYDYLSLGEIGTNVWSAMAGIIKKSRHWSNEMDPIGTIANATPMEDTLCDLPF